MKASIIALRSGPILVLVGMAFGLYMAAHDDHSGAAAHAHLNLLGFVCTVLMGLVYRMSPEIDASRLARAQIWLWLASTVVMFPSLVAYVYGYDRAELGTIISAHGAFVSMLIFTVNAWRITGRS